MSKKNEMTKTAAADLATAPELEDASMMVKQADPRELAKLIADGYAIEKVVALEEGQQISGIFDGEGGTIEVNTPGKDAAGNPLGKQSVRTWRLRSEKGNMVAILLSCAQFESRFPKTPVGTLLTIVKLPKVQTRAGTYANDFHIFAKEPVTTGHGALAAGVVPEVGA